MSSRPVTILLVEDDASLGQLLMEELEVDGYRVRRVSMVAEARTALADERPGLIVSDLRLPDGDGLEILSLRLTSPRYWPLIASTVPR